MCNECYRYLNRFTPLEKVHPVTNKFLTGWSLPLKADGGLMPVKRTVSSVRN